MTGQTRTDEDTRIEIGRLAAESGLDVIAGTNGLSLLLGGGELFAGCDRDCLLFARGYWAATVVYRTRQRLAKARQRSSKKGQ